jgi:hypothetical protein
MISIQIVWAYLGVCVFEIIDFCEDFVTVGFRNSSFDESCPTIIPR